MTKSYVYEAHLGGMAKVVGKSWGVGELGAVKPGPVPWLV